MKTAKQPLARDIMHRDVVKVPYHMTVQELEELFETRHITGAPVVDDFGKLLGVVSETDIIRFDASHPRREETPHSYFKVMWEEGESPAEREDFEDHDATGDKTVEDIMTPWTISAQEDAPVSEVALIMVEREVHRILIVDKEAQLKGIITTMDIARYVAKEGIL